MAMVLVHDLHSNSPDGSPSLAIARGSRDLIQNPFGPSEASRFFPRHLCGIYRTATRWGARAMVGEARRVSPRQCLSAGLGRRGISST